MPPGGKLLIVLAVAGKKTSLGKWGAVAPRVAVGGMLLVGVVSILVETCI
jgi:hypothetical protein